jgi:hypothetical protein
MGKLRRLSFLSAGADADVREIADFFGTAGLGCADPDAGRDQSARERLAP